MPEIAEPSVPRHVVLVKESTTGYVKLCFTVDLFVRLKHLQAANARELCIVWSYMTTDYVYLKHMLMTYMKTNYEHVRADWFQLSNNDLIDFVCACAPACVHRLLV